MENIFVEFLPPWVETGLQPAFYDKESGTVLQQTARMYARVNMLIRMFNKLSRNTKNEIERFETAVNEDMTQYKHDINETVADYIEQFNQLHDYVHDYFDNLDVQEEINNKLDQMLEDGVLEEIIEAFLQTNAQWCFESVADMKQATNFIDGSIARTLGFYTAGDQGGAEYIIKTASPDDTVDEVTIIAITDSLNAHLIVETPMNIKQFGCKGDDSTNDTANLNIAMSTCNDLIIPSGNYIITRFLPNDNQTITGEGYPTIKTNGLAPQVALNDNNVIRGVKFKSISESLEWNRCMVDHVSNVTLENCSFEDFKHTSGSPNAWGVLMGHASNIKLENCYFSGNSQSDIAMIDGCDNVTIDRCSGTALKINIEPNAATDHITNLLIKECTIDSLALQENNYKGTCNLSTTVINCNINQLGYDGATTTMIGCKIGSFINMPQSNVIYAGSLKLINTGNFSKNLINDPFIDNFRYNSSPNTVLEKWVNNYFPIAQAKCIATYKDNDGIFTVLNPDAESASITIRYDGITVTAGDAYLLRIVGKANYPVGSSYTSLGAKITFYDTDSATVGNGLTISLFRANQDSGMTPLNEVTAVINVPDTAVKMRIILVNAASPSGGVTATNQMYYRSVELFKVVSSQLPSTLVDLPVREHRIYHGSSKPQASDLNYNVGDIMYYDDPSTHLGAVCTVAGRPGTWRDF